MNGIEVDFTIKTDPEGEESNCDYETCKKCKGMWCCQRTGCVISPKDLYVFRHEHTKEQRIKYLKLRLRLMGDISIDHKILIRGTMGAYELKGDFTDRNNVTVSKKLLEEGYGALYLRARNKGKRICDIIHYNWEPDGPCVNWSEEEGCRKSFSQRYKGGRKLIPGKSPELCKTEYNELDAAKEWREFQDILYEVFIYFFEKRM